MLTHLEARATRPTTDPASFGFETTDALEPLRDGIGQRRATRALEFALNIDAPGYNLFVLGAPETDRRTLVDTRLAERAAGAATPEDLLYVHDFDARNRPRALRLPAGEGRRLRRDAERFLEDLRDLLPSVFRGEDFRARMAELAGEFEQRQKAVLDEFREQATMEGLALVQTPAGFAFAPARDGRVLERESFDALPTEERGRLEQAVERLTEAFVARMQELPAQQQELMRAQRAAAREFVDQAVTQLVRGFRRHWVERPAVIRWLDGVQADAIEHAPTILALEQQGEGAVAPGAPAARDAFYGRWSVNLVVDHAESRGAPVVHASNPTLEQLVGRIDHRSEYGALVTDFTLIRAGDLHRANGGYLVIDAERLLAKPFAWDALKRALLDAEVRIEQPAEQLGFGRALGLDAEPVPLDVKVVLVGQRRTYYLLSALDVDFPRLFKIPADFEDRIDRTPDNVRRYARMLGTLARDAGLRALDRGAVARVIDHGVRIGGDAGKLSAHTHRIGDLLREADALAAAADSEHVSAAEVEAAIEGHADRLDRLRADVHERIARGTVLVDLEGTAVAQINGLSVLQIGETRFGQPSRITATARMGRGQVLDIEREARLGGDLHTKAVLIVGAFVGRRYAVDTPLSLDATLVFEQSYGGVDGDSATVAEVCTLLSAIAGVPLRQDVAVTGSMNQHGRVQAIGGANEKIEGFHDVCAARGLTGTQGVLIPADNRDSLMLRPDVVAAIEAGRFHVWTMTDVDDALALLTGLTAGERDADGAWSAGSVDARVAEQLARFAAHAAAGRGAPGEAPTLREPPPGPAEPEPGPPPGPEDRP